MVTKMITNLKGSYPTIYRTLIAERNIVMAMRLLELLRKPEHERILAVVGAGHEEEIARIVSEGYRKIDVIGPRLAKDNT